MAFQRARNRVRRESARAVHCRPTMEEDVEPRDRDQFERLWMLRQVYAYRSRYDSDPVLSVEAALAYGELLLRLSRSQRYFWTNQVA